VKDSPKHARAGQPVVCLTPKKSGPASPPRARHPGSNREAVSESCRILTSTETGGRSVDERFFKQVPMSSRWRILVYCWVLVCTSVLMSIPADAQSEDPFSIRVDSNLVLIHTEVYDQKEMYNVTEAYKQCRIADWQRFNSLPFSVPFTASDCYYHDVIHGLGAKDFHVLEDGVEQKIDSVRYEHESLFSARDNLGSHGEWSQTPRAKWSTIDLGSEWQPIPLLYFYRAGYVPSRPERGKCRKVKVTVNHPHAAVYANERYCYLSNAATDPLHGTKLGLQMERDLQSRKRAWIPLAVQVGVFYTNSQTARVDIALGFPWDKLKHGFFRGDLQASIGVLGVAYNKNQTVAARFSDFACCASGTRWIVAAWAEAGILPSHYETQIDLPAGAEYELRVVLSDGESFGRVVIPLVIDANDGKQFAISSVVLCDRYRDAKVAAEEAEAANLAPQYVPFVSQGLQFTPASRTRFKPSEHVMAYFEVYQPVSGEQPPTDVKAHVRIIDARTGEKKFEFYPVDAKSYKRPGSRVLAFAGDLSIAQLPKGEYRVEAQATDSAGHSTAVRSIGFAIE
jgi:hypothetical protein